MRKLEIVIPAYNESQSLPSLLLKTKNAAISAGFSAKDFNVIVVDNGSTDQSEKVLTEMKADPAYADWFRTIRVFPNQGYGHGIYEGLSKTSAEYIGWTHADLQCNPSDIFKAFNLTQTACGRQVLAKGRRTKRNRGDRFVTAVFETVAKIFLLQNLSEVNAQPKVFSSRLLRHLSDYPKHFAFDLYVLSKSISNGYSIETFEVAFPPRAFGYSKWAFSLASRAKTIVGMLRFIIEFSAQKLLRKSGA